ncbi:MAG: hypothetical protein RSC43_09115, partial [Clostridia bacterium]
MPRLSEVGTPPPPQFGVARYDKFNGVDFGVDPARIDASRSPHAPNLISDAGGYPEKRVGWRTITNKVEAPINGIFSFDTAKTSCFIVHGGTRIYKWDGTEKEPVLLRSDVNNGRSSSIIFAGLLLILTGNEFLTFDGTDIKSASEKAYVPLVTTGKPVKKAGGTSYQPVNMLTKRRKVGIVVDESSNSIHIASPVVPGSVKITYPNGSEWEHPESGQVITSIDYYDVYTTIHLMNYISGVPGVPGVDDLIVAFDYNNKATTDKYLERVNKCTIITNYSNRIFISGNPDFPNVDWYSELNDPFYISDIGYTEIGDGTPIKKDAEKPVDKPINAENKPTNEVEKPVDVEGKSTGTVD